MRVHLAYRERGLDIDVPATATVVEPVHHEAAPDGRRHPHRTRFPHNPPVVGSSPTRLTQWCLSADQHSYAKAAMPVMSRPTISVCMVSVPSKVWMASRSAMCRMTW